MSQRKDRHLIVEKIKKMLRDALEFDVYRKSLFEDYWPRDVEVTDDNMECATNWLEDILMQMKSDTEQTLREKEYKEETSDIPF